MKEAGWGDEDKGGWMGTVKVEWCWHIVNKRHISLFRQSSIDLIALWQFSIVFSKNKQLNWIKLKRKIEWILCICMFCSIHLGFKYNIISMKLNRKNSSQSLIHYPIMNWNASHRIIFGYRVMVYALILNFISIIFDMFSRLTEFLN